MEGGQRAFARKLFAGKARGDDGSTLVGKWQNGHRLPCWESLREIARVFRRPGDWLLAFADAEQDLPFEAEMRNALRRHRPVSSPDDIVSSSGDLVAEVAGAWWNAKLRDACEPWRDPFRELIRKLEAIDKATVGGVADVVALDVAKAYARRSQSLLDSPFATWEDLRRETAPAPLTRTMLLDLGMKVTEVSTTFPVIGGHGFAWMRDGLDHVVCIDATSKEVVVRAGEGLLLGHPPRRGLADFMNARQQ
jgi:hypothetical protein